MEKGKGYIGKIGQGSTQVVTAPAQSAPAKTGTVKKGGDLRAGKK